jgi:hypothetical protein
MESVAIEREPSLIAAAPPGEAATSAVSWTAIIAGALVAASLSLLLLTLGSGLGLASVSPWPGAGASATTFTVMTAIWLIVVQWVASGAGGYLTGRLRSRWVRTHTHEVFFRDTAHGFITWALATVAGAAVLASAASVVIGTGVRAAGTMAVGAAQSVANTASPSINPYDVDTLLRSARPDANTPPSDARAEVTRILAKGVTTRGVSAADRSYLKAIIAERTGIPPEEAQKRLDDVTAQIQAVDTKARQAADTARQAGAMASIYTALSMLIGAFIASAAAALGGRHRDAHW